MSEKIMSSLLIMTTRGHTDPVSLFYLSPFEDPYKYPFLGHYAVACLIIDRAPRMAFLPYLTDLPRHLIADTHYGPNRERDEVYSFGGDILCKIARRYVEPLLLHLGDALDGQEAHLSVPLRGSMRVAFDSEFRLQHDLFDRLLPDTFFPAYID